jgi:glycine dehydrogenase subunit 1
VPGDVPSLLAKLLDAGYHAGLPTLPGCVTVAVTEKRTKAEIDGLTSAFAAQLADANGATSDVRRATAKSH